jgi:hypothetical protein
MDLEQAVNAAAGLVVQAGLEIVGAVALCHALEHGAQAPPSRT